MDTVTARRICGPCAGGVHGASECLNRTLPMIEGNCPCTHGIEKDPAPYWSQTDLDVTTVDDLEGAD